MANQSRNKEPSQGRFIHIIKKALDEMAARRTKAGVWNDSEKEPEGWTNAHRACDALEAFLTCRKILPEVFMTVPYNKKLLLEDMAFLLDCVKENNFEPGAYVPTAGYQAIDYAADVVTTCLDFSKYAADIRLKHKLARSIDQTVDKAIAFLEESACESPDGCRWAGTTLAADEKPTYCHVYFTCAATKGLYSAWKHHKRLDEVRRERLKELVQGAQNWLSKRKRAGLYYSDERWRTTEATSALYNVDALFSSWELIEDQRIKSFAQQCLKDFYVFLQTRREEFDLYIFYPVPLQGIKAPVQLEDRTTTANCLKVLCLGKSLLEKSEIIDQRFLDFLNELANDVVDEMEPDENVWERDQYLVYSNLRAIEGLLLFQRYGAQEEIEKFSLFDYRQAVKAALSSEAVMKAFMDEFRKVSKHREERHVEDVERE